MRLIDAEALEQDFYDHYDRKGYRNGKSLIYAGWCLLKKLIDNAPTIEAKPVVHAHWEVNGMHLSGVVGNWKCSACKRPSLDDSDYCPYCGAQMDEREDDNG